MKKRVLWIIVVLVIIFSAIALIKVRKNKENKLTTAKTYSVVVTSIVPKLAKVQLTLPYIALVQNDADVNLSTKITGRVDFIKRSGSKLKKGDLIARIDDTDIRGNISSLESQIVAAKTSLNNLKSTHQRTLDLLAVKGASIEQSQKEESNIAMLKAQLESLEQKLYETKNMLSYSQIESPVDGVLSKTMLNVGDVTIPGHPVGNISAENGFYFLVRTPVELPVKGIIYGDHQYQTLGLNSTFNGLREYKSYLNNVKLSSGSREQIDVVVFDGEGIKLPHDAILNRDGKTYVFVAKSDKAQIKEVTILQSGENGIVVNDKDLIGKQIIVAKQDILLKLLSGVSINIKEE